MQVKDWLAARLKHSSQLHSQKVQLVMEVLAVMVYAAEL